MTEYNSKNFNLMYKALVEISKGEGAYSMDKLQHASNTIENMKNIAKEVIKKVTK